MSARDDWGRPTPELPLSHICSARFAVPTLLALKTTVQPISKPTNKEREHAASDEDNDGDERRPRPSHHHEDERDEYHDTDGAERERDETRPNTGQDRP